MDLKAPMVEPEIVPLNETFRAASRAGCRVLKSIVTSMVEVDPQARLLGMDEDHRQAIPLEAPKVSSSGPSHNLYQIKRYMREYYHQKSMGERAKGYCPARICVSTSMRAKDFAEKFWDANDNRKVCPMIDSCLSLVQSRTLIEVAWAQPALTNSLHAEDFAEAVRERLPSK